VTKIPGPKKGELTGSWRNLYNEEFHDLCCIGNISRMVKSRKIRCLGRVSHMGKFKNAHKILVRNPTQYKMSWKEQV
jgi:hypothetical protein